MGEPGSLEAELGSDGETWGPKRFINMGRWFEFMMQNKNNYDAPNSWGSH